MTVLRTDPGRLARPAKHLERDGYAVAGELLRDYLGGGDIFAAVREHVLRDPQLRAKVAGASSSLAPAGNSTPRVGRHRARRPSGPR